jgi:anti-sigma B factor antagonist
MAQILRSGVARLDLPAPRSLDAIVFSGTSSIQATNAPAMMLLNFEVIEPSGILNITQANQLQSQVDALVSAGVKGILIDLKNVSFMDSSGLAGLVIALKAIRAVGGQLCICSLNDQVRLLFELTNMMQVFDIFATRDAFEQSLKVV